MSLQLQIEAGLLVALSAILSLVIGINRERFDQPAGLRTHILVGMGACAFTLLSIHAFPNSDQSRVAAQIVSGLGFLGAGAILKQKDDIRGLTTAANLWSTASIGMAVGAGAWLFAVIITLLMWAVLVLVRRFSVRILGTKEDD